MELNSVSLSSREVPNDEFMPPKRTLCRLKLARDVRVTRMTCSYPPEARRPVTIVVVTYKDRGNNPFTDEVTLMMRGIGKRRAHCGKCAPPHGMTLLFKSWMAYRI